MRHSLDSGFTLVELIVVVIIMGVLATLAIPQFTASRERSLGYEAQANLKLIAAAQKVYRLEVGFYFPCTGGGACTGAEDDIADINSNLKLSTNENNWNYGISGAGAGSFSATAVRSGCTYTVAQNGADPVPSGSCP